MTSTTGLDHPVQAALRTPFTYVQIAGVRLDLNPSVHDPISALGACADVVTRCYLPPMRSLDVCVDFVRVCATDTPWNEPPCCPVSCRAGYHAARTRGDAPLDAFEHVYLDAPTCVPGVASMAASQP